MKALVLFLTFVISFSLATIAVSSPATGLLGGAPDVAAQDQLSIQISDSICKIVGVNGMVAQRNKNSGIPIDESVSQLVDAFNNAGDQGQPGEVALNISLGAVQAVYAEDINATTKEELVTLGLTLYNICRTTVDKIQWGIQE